MGAVSTVTRGREGAEPVSVRVVEAVAAAEGVPVDDLPNRLHGSIDTDALDALYGRGRTGASVTFTHLGYRVSVDEHGEVDVRPR
ncbi:HalOD1 output domain-containing protein [Halobaculum sp. EA56]|uniref:HalOD1 output domain-containing protein n=1 Tax=Halobaculum sp. EA56 TaxID=3421648 RepID=UPI003EBF085F